MRHWRPLALAALIAPTLALAEPDLAEVASCAAFVFALSSDVSDGPPYAIVAGRSDLAFAFYNEAHRLTGFDTDALNAMVADLMPRYAGLGAAVFGRLDDVAAGKVLAFRQTEQARCDRIGAELPATQPFYHRDASAALFAPPVDAARDPEDLAYNMGWYGGSCLGYVMAQSRVSRELGLPPSGLPAFNATEVVSSPTGWATVDLLLHAQDRAAEFTAAARVILPLADGDDPLPEAEVRILRNGQTDCQTFEMTRNMLEPLLATP